MLGAPLMTSEQPGRPEPAPIPPSFYERESLEPRSGKPPPSASTARTPGVEPWWRSLPGFRTGKRWKQVVAVFGYLVIAIWIVQIESNPALSLFGLLSLAAVWLATNAFGIRTKLPAFGSPNRLVAGGAWSGLVIAMLVTASAASPPPGTSNAGVGAGPTSPSPIAAAVANSSSPTASSGVASAPSSPTQSPIPTPKQSPVQAPSQAPSPPPVAFDFCGAPANPWHYNFCASDIGKYVTSPPSGFCSYFSCISSFWQGSGWVAECSDGAYSLSGGRSGACSHHGGVLRPLWA